jgi:predicted Rossmann fold nucleotide-binding protein DprA/Smf involved in DNA uptake
MAQRCIGIVGARVLPDSFRGQISDMVRYLLERDYHIHSGGALGADMYVLQALIEQRAIDRGLILSAWASVDGFPREVQRYIEYYVSHRGRVSWGIVPPRASRGLAIAGLLARNQRLVRSSVGIIAFLYGDSTGTIRTIREAIRLGRRVVVFVCGGGAVLPQVSGQWVSLRCSIRCWGGAFLYRR